MKFSEMDLMRYVMVSATAASLAAVFITLKDTGINQNVDPQALNRRYTEDGNLIIFTEEEIAPYDGSVPGRPYYLVVLGKVFDVTEGEKYYKKGEGYNVFLGQDSSRAFATGEFDREDNKKKNKVMHKMKNFTDELALALKEWVDFYEKHEVYKQIGVLYMEDGYYDMKGHPTALLQKTEQRFADALAKKEASELKAEDFPDCKSKYNREKGGRVWCEDEGLVPRKGKMEWDSRTRCACYSLEFANSHPDELTTYTNCSPTATECTYQYDANFNLI
eukprot:m.38407 g.38407  ORF g.38407 m.38407 type:complete len:276 (+) comp9433_c0_seq1:284-1111(+)